MNGEKSIEMTSEEKKETFMTILQSVKENPENIFFDEYQDLTNNTGPLGVIINNITDEGKITISLSENMKKQTASNLSGYIMPRFLVFSETELEEFISKYYDMNNMEVLTEFISDKNPPHPNDRTFPSLQELKALAEGYYSEYNKLVVLNALDYINTPSDAPIRCTGGSFHCKNGVSLITVENTLFIIDEDGNHVEYDIKSNKITHTQIINPEFQETIDRLNQSIEDLPRIYTAIKAGTYKKEDFIPQPGKPTLFTPEDIANATNPLPQIPEQSTEDPQEQPE